MSAPRMHLTDRVKLDLLRLIEAGDLKPGDKLPSADRLCDQFAVSRTVIREAIATLKAQGRLRSLRGSGVYVAEPMPVRGEFSSFMASPTEVEDTLDFMEFRVAVEIEAAGLAAERRTEMNLMRMAQALALFRHHAEDNTLSADADRSFHRSIAEATHNARFRMFIDDIGDRLIPRRALGPSFADDRSRQEFLDLIQAEHLRVYEAITDRRPDEAREAMRRHLEDGRRRYRQFSLQRALTP